MTHHLNPAAITDLRIQITSAIQVAVSALMPHANPDDIHDLLFEPGASIQQLAHRLAILDLASAIEQT